jgi:hypothetical protein
MDGVLADFDRRKLEVFGRMDVPDDFMWETIHRSEPKWFLNLPMFPGAHELITYLLDNCGKFDSAILTAMSKKNIVSCAAQKQAWFRNYWNTALPVITCLRSHKQDYAQPGHVLIDDWPKNVDQFRKKGGIGILHKSAESTIAQLKEIFK